MLCVCECRWLGLAYKGEAQQHFKAAKCRTNGQVLERSYYKTLSDAVHRGKVCMDLSADMTANCENPNEQALKNTRVGGSPEFRNMLLSRTFCPGVHGFLTAIVDGKLIDEDEQQVLLDESAAQALKLRPILKMHLKPGSVNLRSCPDLFNMFAVWAIATNNPGSAVLHELTAIRDGTAVFSDLVSINTEAFLRCVYSTLAATNFDAKPKWYHSIAARVQREISQVRLLPMYTCTRADEHEH